MTGGSATTPSSRAEATVELIERMITEGLRPGDRIGTKEELRQQAGVAVGTFNEALRLLLSRGAVTVRPGPGGGLFVSEPSATVRLGTAVLALRSEIGTIDVLRVRDALDPLVIDDAVTHATDADVRELRKIAAELGRTVHDPVAYLDLTWQLHARMAEISPNPILRSLYLSLMDIARSNTADTDAGRPQLHAEIVEAIGSRDRTRAAALARRRGRAFTQL